MPRPRPRQSTPSRSGPTIRRPSELLRIATTTPNRKHRLVAIEGYVRLVGRANMTGRKARSLPGPPGPALRRRRQEADIIGAAAIREPEALRLLAVYLENPVLGEAAAAGLLEMASEQAPQERWLSGHEAYSVLRRVQARTAEPAEKETGGPDHRCPPSPGRLRAALRRPRPRRLEGPRRRSPSPGQDDPAGTGQRPGRGRREDARPLESRRRRARLRRQGREPLHGLRLRRFRAPRRLEDREGRGQRSLSSGIAPGPDLGSRRQPGRLGRPLQQPEGEKPAAREGRSHGRRMELLPRHHDRRARHRLSQR